MSRKSTKNRQFIVDYKDFELIFDVEHSTILTWISQGMPVFDNSDTKRLFNIPDCIYWFRDREIARKLGPRLDPAQETAKKTAVQTELLKLELAEKTGELSSNADFIKFGIELTTTCNRNLCDIAKTIGPQREDFQTDTELELAIQELIDNALRNMSKGFDEYVNRKQQV